MGALRLHFRTAAILLALALPARAAVESVRFDSDVLPPVARLPERLTPFEGAFRAGLQSMPEGPLILSGMMLARDELGLTDERFNELAPLITDAYAAIAADPNFAGVPSALPYCFVTDPHDAGHYFLYRPESLPADPKCIVFLHGYGGNFKFYMWALKEAFPAAVILAPSWGLSWHRGDPHYVEAMLADARRRTGAALDRPWLMAISAGGRGGFAVYNAMGDDFRGYVCLASAPMTANARRLRPDLRILMINGARDRMVPPEAARRQARLARRRVPTLRYEELDGTHFFFLSHREAMFERVRGFMEEVRTDEAGVGLADEEMAGSKDEQMPWKGLVALMGVGVLVLAVGIVVRRRRRPCNRSTKGLH